MATTFCMNTAEKMRHDKAKTFLIQHAGQHHSSKQSKHIYWVAG